MASRVFCCNVCIGDPVGMPECVLIVTIKSDESASDIDYIPPDLPVDCPYGVEDICDWKEQG